MTKRPIFFCRNEECPNRPAVNANAKPLVLKDEYQSAWNFQCPVCRGFQVFTKDLVGGTFGQGRRNDLTGNSVNKGRDRFRPGLTFSS